MPALDPWTPLISNAHHDCQYEELFRSSQVSVTTVECGANRGGTLHHRTWDQPAIVLVRTGRFARRVGRRCSVVDATQGYIGHAGDEEVIEHLGSFGHRCTVLTLHSYPLPLLFGVRSRLMATEFRTSPATDLAHRLLLAECRRAGDTAVVSQLAAVLVADLLVGWAQSSSSAHRVGTRAATRRVVDIARELVTTSSIAPSLQSVATAVNISPQHLTRVFRQNTGMTLSRYRNRVRVRLALEMLADEESDLKWIAHDLGFFDRSHFSKVLTAEVGLPPLAVRRRLSPPGRSTLATRPAGRTGPVITRSA